MKSLLNIFKRNIKLIENFSYLSILQVLNLVLPLLILPYLLRVLGSHTYGLVIYSQTILGYFVILINFGFTVTATKEISLHRDSPEKLNEIMSSVYIIKFILFLITVLILLMLIFIIPEFREYKLLYFLTLWLCVYELIFPTHYFQGIEEMKFITIITLISRIILFSCIFIFVKSDGDYLLVPLFNGIGAIVAGIISQIIVYKKGIRYAFVSFPILKDYTKKAYVMALAYGANTLKYNLNIILVQFFFSYREVAYFDLALKVARLGSSFLELVGIAVFPKMSREKNKNFLLKMIYMSGALSIAYLIVIFLFAPLIVKLLGGNEMLEAIDILKIVIFSVPFQVIGAFLGRNCLIVHGFDKDVLKSMLYSGIFYIAGILVSYKILDFTSASIIAVIFVLSFAYETYYRYLKCREHKII